MSRSAALRSWRPLNQVELRRLITVTGTPWEAQWAAQPRIDAKSRLKPWARNTITSVRGASGR